MRNYPGLHRRATLLLIRGVAEMPVWTQRTITGPLNLQSRIKGGGKGGGGEALKRVKHSAKVEKAVSRILGSARE